MICDFCIQPIGKFYRERDFRTDDLCFRTLLMVAIFKIVGDGSFPSVVSEVSEVVKPLNRATEFTSIYRICTRFLASAAMYMRNTLLFSTLRIITVERRPKKRTFSSARLWWCGILTFF